MAAAGAVFCLISLLLCVGCAVSVFLFGGCSGLAKYTKITCVGKITPEMPDSEANAKAARWLKHSKIYLTPARIAGFRGGITALRYEAIARIYGGRKDPDDLKGKFLIAAVTAGEKEYTLCETPPAGTLDMGLSQELNLIYRECKAPRPEIACGK